MTALKDPKGEARLDSLVHYLRTDSAFDRDRRYAVSRVVHDIQCQRLLDKAFGHVTGMMRDRGTPLPAHSAAQFRRLLDRAWAERKSEIRPLIPIWQETSLGLH